MDVKDSENYTNDDVLKSIWAEIDENVTKNEITPKPSISADIPQAENLESFIIENSAKSVNTTQSVIDILLQQAESTSDPELIASLAEMIAANNKSIDTLTKLHLNREKLKQAKEMEIFKQQAKLMASDTPANYNQPLTRESIMTLLDEKKEEANH